MDWSSIIQALIESGAFLGIFLIAEKKTAALLEAVDKRSAAIIEQSQKLIEEYRALADERQEEVAQLRALVSKKDEELLAGQKEKSDLRNELDEAHTEISVKSLMYCQDAKCINRNPPFGCRADEILNRYRQRTARKENNGNDQ